MGAVFILAAPPFAAATAMPAARDKKTPDAKGPGFATPDLLALCLTWPQAGRLKSPRIGVDCYAAMGSTSRFMHDLSFAFAACDP
jgi:hypothetical protein